jgi:hypothetical protein
MGPPSIAAATAATTATSAEGEGKGGNIRSVKTNSSFSSSALSRMGKGLPKTVIATHFHELHAHQLLPNHPEILPLQMQVVLKSKSSSSSQSFASTASASSLVQADIEKVIPLFKGM